jgi:hypothetical protein
MKLINAFQLFKVLILFLFLGFNLNAQVPEGKKPLKSITIGPSNKNFNIEIYPASFQKTVQKSNETKFKDSVIQLFKDSIRLYIKTDRNVSLYIHGDAVHIPVRIGLEQVNVLRIKGGLKERVFIYNTSHRLRDGFKINSIFVDNAIIREANLENIAIKDLYFRKSQLDYLNVKNAEISKSFTLKQVRLDSGNFEYTFLPRLITLDTLDLCNVSKLIDFTRLRHLNTSTPGSFDLDRTIRISDTDLDKFKLPYDRINFHIDTLQDFMHRKWIYEKLLKNLSDAVVYSSYNYYNEQYTDILDEGNHRAVRNWVNRIWWNKGHNRGRVLMFSLLIFSFYIVGNYLFFNRLKNTYMPDVFKDYNVRIEYKYLGPVEQQRKTQYFFYYLFGIFLYTSYLFWALRLDLSSLRIRNFFVLGFIILQYLSGALFVAYLVSFIIVRL